MFRTIRDWFKYHYNNWRYPPRPMKGFWSTLTSEQQEHILNNKIDISSGGFEESFETLTRYYVDCVDQFDSYDPDGSPESYKTLNKIVLRWYKAELDVYEFLAKNTSRIEQLKKSIEDQQKKIGE